MSVETPNPLSQYNGPVPFGSPMPTNMQTGGPDYSRQAPPPTQLPRFMDTGGMLPPRMSDPFTQSAPPPTMQGGVRDGQGNVYASRESTPRAYTGGAFNPAANQWGDYSQATGDGLWGTDAQGINRVNGHVFAPSGLTSGNTDFANWMARFAPQYAQQNGPINQGRAYVGPQGMSGAGQMPGSMGATNGLGRGGTPPGLLDPRGMPGGPHGMFGSGGGSQGGGGGMFHRPNVTSYGPGTPPATSGISRTDPSQPPPVIDPRTGQPVNYGNAGIDPATGQPYSRNPFLKSY